MSRNAVCERMSIFTILALSSNFKNFDLCSSESVAIGAGELLSAELVGRSLYNTKENNVILRTSFTLMQRASAHPYRGIASVECAVQEA